MKVNSMVVGVILSLGLYACGMTCDMVTNTWARTSVEAREVEQFIALAPAMMLSQTNNVGEYIAKTCEKISKVSDAQARYGYFRKLMKSACRVDIGSVEGMVSIEKIEMPNVDDLWKPSVRTLEERAQRKRERRIAGIEGRVRGRLESLADKIFAYLLTEPPLPAPSAELLEPYFKLIEKLREEERREGRKPMSLSGHVINQVEYLFTFIYLESLDAVKVKPDSKDLVAFNARFKQVVGRPIRSAEQYEADARRRREALQKAREKEKGDLRKGKVVQESTNGDTK